MDTHEYKWIIFKGKETVFSYRRLPIKCIRNERNRQFSLENHNSNFCRKDHWCMLKSMDESLRKN